jgi:hypothetical protein
LDKATRRTETPSDIQEIPSAMAFYPKNVGLLREEERRKKRGRGRRQKSTLAQISLPSPKREGRGELEKRGKR